MLQRVVMAVAAAPTGKGRMDTGLTSLVARNRKGPLVLVVDDEVGIVDMIQLGLKYEGYRSAAAFMRERLEAENGYRYRSAPLPPTLRRVSLEAASQAYDPELLAKAVGDLLKAPPPIDVRHVRRPGGSIEERLRHLRGLLARDSRFSFDEAVAGADRLTEAVTLFALLELYKAGEARWEQSAPFGPITVVGE